jgi:regulator of sigma E protease
LLATAFNWFAAVLAFGLLIAFHELGHLWVARRMGMRVERYSLGFGPVLWAFRRGETEYVLSAVPLGGYVRIAGMNPEDEVADDDAGAYANKPAWRRFLVIAAGPAANYLLAFLIGVPLLMAATRTSPDLRARVGAVEPGSAAEHAGLAPDDLLLSLDGVAIADFDGLVAAVQAASKTRPGAELSLVLTRGGQRLERVVTPRAGPDGIFRLGISRAELPVPPRSLAEAVPAELELLWSTSVRSLHNFGRLFTRELAPTELTGPIGMLSMTAKQAGRGLASLLDVVWFLSVAVGFFNLLPVPGLDGGRMMFLGYEVLARRRVNQRVETAIHLVGLLAVLGLVVAASYGDIVRRLGG